MKPAPRWSSTKSTVDPVRCGAEFGSTRTLRSPLSTTESPSRFFVEGEAVGKAGAAHALDEDPELLAFGLGHLRRKLVDLFDRLFGKRNHRASCVPPVRRVLYYSALHRYLAISLWTQSTPCSASHRSASMAAMQPVPAAVTACR